MGFFVYSGHKAHFLYRAGVMRKIDPVLYERLAKLIGSMGYELVGCELLPQGRQMVFRIYIDGKNGVTLDDCSLVSHQVSAMLDVEDPIQSRYSLEVSSPGIDRPLFELEHYRKHIGKQVRVRLHSPVNQRRQYKGVLQRVEGEDVYLLVEGMEQAVKLPFSLIEKANLIGDVRF
jgi:ribosome maturation factor RimP